MRNYKRYAFTLVELIVVITILAILGTIAFISMRNYAQSARNSHRISDMKIIEKAMSLLGTVWSEYPSPDESTSITYSGGLAWTQWIFSTGGLAYIQRISNIPKDPLFWVQYSYSLSENNRKYQISAALEGAITYSQNPFVSQVYALSASNLYGYTLGNYIAYDTPIFSGTGCSIIATPSMMLSDIPSGWIILNDEIYNYIYSKSGHIPNNYSSVVNSITPASGFQNTEVLNSCSIDTIGELELYIAKLSTAYIWLSSLPQFETLIYNSNSQSFQLSIIANLQDYGIQVEQSIIDILQSPNPDYVFTDTFTDTNGISILSGHIPDSLLGSWTMLGSGNTSAYDISGNTLEKNGSTNTIVWPVTNPIISNINYGMSFDVEDFSGGDVSAYLRYTDSDNYYKLTVSSTGYQVMRRLWWSDSVFQTIVETINPWSNISFSVSGDSLIFGVDEIEKENIVAGWLNSIWSPGISIQNSGANIDNYTFTYK